MTAFDRRPLVYVAGPYAHPDPVANTNRAIGIADDLQEFGDVTCHVPHLTLLWHMVRPHDVEHWYAYDLAVLARCDALLRLDGPSSGADNEVLFAQRHDIPVFTSPAALLLWARAVGP